MGTGLATMAVKGLTIGAGGAAGNAVWDALKLGSARARDHLRDPKRRLPNHDLQALAGRAIAVVVAAAARDCGDNKVGRRYLKRILDRFPDSWSRVTLDARYGAFLDDAIPEYFRDTTGSTPTTAVLSVDAWQDLLGTLSGRQPSVDEQQALALAAQCLHRDFARALFEFAKEDFSPDSTGSPHEGKAFAALLLSLINNIMGGIDELLTTHSATLKNSQQALHYLEHLRGQLHERSSLVARLAPQDVAAIVIPLKRDIDSLVSDLATRDALLSERQTILEGQGRALQVTLRDHTDHLLAIRTAVTAHVNIAHDVQRTTQSVDRDRLRAYAERLRRLLTEDLQRLALFGEPLNRSQRQALILKSSRSGQFLGCSTPGSDSSGHGDIIALQQQGDSDTNTLTTWLDSTQRSMLLIGPAGSGKSATLAYYALLLADTLATVLDNTEADVPALRIPLPVRLSSLVGYVERDGFARFTSLLFDSQRLLAPDDGDGLLSVNDFQYLLAQGRFILLLDGFDELPTGPTASPHYSRRMVIDALRALGSRHILSCRPGCELETRVQESCQRMIEPLSHNDIDAYLTARLGHDPTLTTAAHRAQLRLHPEVASLLQRPLFLSAWCSRVMRRDAMPPGTSTALLDAMVRYAASTPRVQRLNIGDLEQELDRLGAVLLAFAEVGFTLQLTDAELAPRVREHGVVDPRDVLSRTLTLGVALGALVQVDDATWYALKVPVVEALVARVLAQFTDSNAEGGAARFVHIFRRWVWLPDMHDILALACDRLRLGGRTQVRWADACRDWLLAIGDHCPLARADEPPDPNWSQDDLASPFAKLAMRLGPPNTRSSSSIVSARRKLDRHHPTAHVPILSTLSRRDAGFVLAMLLPPLCHSIDAQHAEHVLTSVRAGGASGMNHLLPVMFQTLQASSGSAAESLSRAVAVWAYSLPSDSATRLQFMRGSHASLRNASMTTVVSLAWAMYEASARGKWTSHDAVEACWLLTQFGEDVSTMPFQVTRPEMLTRRREAFSAILEDMFSTVGPGWPELCRVTVGLTTGIIDKAREDETDTEGDLSRFIECISHHPCTVQELLIVAVRKLAPCIATDARRHLVNGAYEALTNRPGATAVLLGILQHVLKQVNGPPLLSFNQVLRAIELGTSRGCLPRIGSYLAAAARLEPEVDHRACMDTALQRELSAGNTYAVRSLIFHDDGAHEPVRSADEARRLVSALATAADAVDQDTWPFWILTASEVPAAVSFQDANCLAREWIDEVPRHSGRSRTVYANAACSLVVGLPPQDRLPLLNAILQLGTVMPLCEPGLSLHVHKMVDSFDEEQRTHVLLQCLTELDCSVGPAPRATLLLMRTLLATPSLTDATIGRSQSALLDHLKRGTLTYKREVLATMRACWSKDRAVRLDAVFLAEHILACISDIRPLYIPEACSALESLVVLGPTESRASAVDCVLWVLAHIGVVDGDEWSNLIDKLLDQLPTTEIEPVTIKIMDAIDLCPNELIASACHRGLANVLRRMDQASLLNTCERLLSRVLVEADGPKRGAHLALLDVGLPLLGEEAVSSIAARAIRNGNLAWAVRFASSNKALTVIVEPGSAAGEWSYGVRLRRDASLLLDRDLALCPPLIHEKCRSL